MATATPVAEAAEFQFAVGGMTCAACAARVQKVLNKLDGVTAAVNYSSERAVVLAPRTFTSAQLIGVIEGAGYTAQPVTEQTEADTEQTEAGTEQTVRALRRRLYLALAFFIPLTDASIVLSLFPWARFPGWQWVLVVLAAPVATWAAWPFHRAALKNARHFSSSMDTLVSMGIVAACGWSVYAMFFLDRSRAGLSGLNAVLHASGGGIYLEVAASVTTFLLAGRLYEAKARRTASQAMRLLAEAGAKEVSILPDDPADASELRIPAALLQVGQRFVVRPGERIAADGVVLSGQSAIDRSMMTGESVPADAAEGDTVTGGTIALTGRLIVRADKVGKDTQLAQLIRLVEQAQADKAAIQRLADRICSVFVPCVLACAALTLGGWLLAGTLHFSGQGAEHAFSAALAVLIIACPCALGLATPAALVVASGRGAQLGIFIKGYQALESSRKVDTVVLDKTGTVTTGEMTLVAMMPVTGTEKDDLLRYAGPVEHASEHAVARAIATATQTPQTPKTPTTPTPTPTPATAPAPTPANVSIAHSIPLERVDGAIDTLAVEDFAALPGLGARGVVEGRSVLIGRRLLFCDVPAELDAWCAEQERAGCTTVLVGWDDASRADGAVRWDEAVRVRGALAVADAVKPSAAPAVAELRRLGLRTILLTGDNEATARAVADAAGIDEVVSGALPGEKADFVVQLGSTGRSAIMVGDGVNDGPALSRAQLGMALGSGTDVAICAADMILLRDDLGVVPDAIKLARATYRTIRRNLAWAFCYNLLALPLAALGFLNPLVAAAAMTLSSVFVVWNSLRLRRFSV
jgi:P-type Cu+ transporter